MNQVMNTKNDVEVIINGRTYIISGYESSEYMQKIATHINSKYDEFKKSDSFPKLDQEMKNILLAINLSDDYYKAQDVVVNLQKDNEDLEKEIFHMKHDMIDLKNRLEKQEKKNKSLKEEKRELERKLIQLETKAQSSSKENAEDSQDDSQTDPKETEEKTSTGNALNSSISKSNTVGYKK